MKTRTGFVSNSSSSSFVIFGANIPEKEFNKTKFLREIVGIEDPKTLDDFEDEDEFDDYFYNESLDVCRLGDNYFGFNEEDSSEAGCVLIGVKIVEGDSDCNDIGENSVSVDELSKKFSELKDKLGLTDEIETKIIVGSKVC